ncbi:MAG: small multi-drug export protein [Clostridia bacterium]|nr:small multi-drug export protein [Clostridia bacterium]
MGEKITELLGSVIENEYLLVAILAVIPVTEIKGAILYAAVAKCEMIGASLAAFASSAVLTFAIVPLFPLFLRLAEKSVAVRRVGAFLTDRLERKAGRIIETAGVPGVGKYKSRLILGLYAFVAVPLPFTGIWAGALLAAIMRLDYRSSVFALVCGNFTAGGIVLTLALLAGDKAPYILTIFLYVALAFLIVMLIRALGRKLAERTR